MQVEGNEMKLLPSLRARALMSVSKYLSSLILYNRRQSIVHNSLLILYYKYFRELEKLGKWNNYTSPIWPIHRVWNSAGIISQEYFILILRDLRNLGNNKANCVSFFIDWQIKNAKEYIRFILWHLIEPQSLD